MSRSERSRHSRRGQTPRGQAVAPETTAPAEAKAADVADPTRFEVRCACGITMRGRRHDDEHSVICSSCGTELPLGNRADGSVSRRPVVKSDSRSADDAKIAPTVANVALEVRPRSEAGEDSSGLHPERLEQRRHVTWLRFLALVVVLFVSATAYWGWHSSRQQRFLLELQNATSQGEAALAEAQFDRAVELLAGADRAARGLRSNDAQVRLASQLYREALVWSSLAVEGVDEFCFARAADVAAGSARLREEFDRELAGRSIIIQSRGVRIAREDAPPDQPAGAKLGASAEKATTKQELAGPLPLALDWLIAGENFRVEIDPRDLANIAGVAPAGEQELLFGAELRSLERDPRHPGRWLIRLVPDSCVLLTAPGPFNSVNWPDLQQLEPLLAAQRARILPQPTAVEKAGEAP